jgi:hypothetical protein
LRIRSAAAESFSGRLCGNNGGWGDCFDAWLYVVCHVGMGLPGVLDAIAIVNIAEEYGYTRKLMD